MLPKPLQQLIVEFTRLPGIGPKTATRFALAVFAWEQNEVEGLAQSLTNLKANIKNCEVCFTMTEQAMCRICQNPERNKQVIAVVQKPLDAVALEATGNYDGVYHVLGGTISPIDGQGPEHLNLNELEIRIKKQNVQEIILATNSDLEGETTAMYIADLLKGQDIKITRIARGLPVGGELEYADEITLMSAMEGRREYNK